MLLDYIDLIWLPIGLIVVHKQQRLVAAGYFISCFIMMRMQIEMVVSLGFPNGFLPVFSWPVHKSAIVTYTFFYIAYMLLAYWSKESDKHIFLAASISMFFTALLVSTIVMVL